MIRIIPPIGQGNFAVERFAGSERNINIVFDCGTRSKIKLEERIGNVLPSCAIIDKVFISHLDDDHVNGLQYLLKNYRVNEVYLPYLTEEERVLTRLFYRLKTGYDLSEFTVALLDNPRGTIRESVS